ncbi:MAG: NAD-dependent epimerase/dehydratase family protein [Lautropia sp.]
MNAHRPIVLVTGGSGFLGRAIAIALRDRFQVISLDVAQPRDPLPGVATIELDLTSDDSVRKAVGTAARKGRIASVVHLAAYYDTTGEENPKYDTVTVQGTRRLLAALQTVDVEQFVFSSTLLVHAPSPEKGVRIDEDAPLDPAWAYPKSKVETEILIARERGDIPAVILRFAGVYDEECRAAFLAQQIARIFERLPTAYLFAGNLDAGQPYLHKDDLVDAVVRTIDRRGMLPPDAVFLIGEEQTLSYRELQQRIGQLVHGEPWRTLSLPKGLTKAGSWIQTKVLDEETDIRPWMIENSDDHYEIDISRARRLLGWQPLRKLADTLPEMIRRLEQDPTDWYERNKLEPATVAASKPEIDQAAARLRGPPERDRQTVERELADRHAKTRWAPMVNVALGAWLMTSPMMFGLFDPVAAGPPPALGHELADAHVRNFRLGLSEIVSGLAVIALSLAGLSRRTPWLQWITAALGLWVMLAPLIFWTTSGAAYHGDTLVGMLIVAFAVMVPPTPGISPRALQADDDRPLGWSYSPSSYTQRIPIVALAFLGLFVSRYLAAFQMGHIDGLWDPFFGPGGTPVDNGSEAVVTSWVSKGFPIADAGLGAFAYALDILAGAIGDRRRWRTMPWMVFLFGLLVIPLGVVSVSFIMIQPPLIGALCTLCIIQAVVTVALIPYSIDEVLATVQYLSRARRAGEPLWRTFWKGGPALSEDQRPEPDLDRPVRTVLRDFLVGGVTYPWTLVVSALLGALLMATPLIAGTAAPLYFSDHVAGCLIVMIAVTSMAEVVRPVRWLNIAVGAWVVVSPFLLDGASVLGAAVSVSIGVLVAGLSLPCGTRSDEHYGGWDRAIV